MRLKLMGTVSSDLTRQQWRQLFEQHGWSCEDAYDHSRLRHKDIELSIEGDGFTLLHGYINDAEQSTATIIAVFGTHADTYQLDIYEEDGRLVKRVIQ